MAVKVTKTITIECKDQTEAKEAINLLDKMEFKAGGIKWLNDNKNSMLYGSQIKTMIKFKQF